MDKSTKAAKYIRRPQQSMPSAIEYRGVRKYTKGGTTPPKCAPMQTSYTTYSQRKLDSCQSALLLTPSYSYIPRKSVNLCLQTTVNLLHNIMSTIVRPIPTCLCRNTRHLPLRNLRRLLHQIHIQPGAHMPCNVAMERPNARVIGVILHN